MSIYTLYVKTHNKTGLKYLGFTKLDPFTYKGSGKYWNSHLKVHGNDVTTAILFQSQSKSDIKPIGLQYSKLWNIVESTEWANLKPEDGYGGYVPKHLRPDTRGDKNGRYDSNIYTFYNLDTGKVVSSTRYNFYNTYNIRSSGVCDLIKGVRFEINGWSMTPVRQQLPTYQFHHMTTNITVYMTQRDFCDQYQLRYSIITEVINRYGRRKSYKGWSVIT
jgi:hypothetical protein